MPNSEMLVLVVHKCFRLKSLRNSWPFVILLFSFLIFSRLEISTGFRIPNEERQPVCVQEKLERERKERVWFVLEGRHTPAFRDILAKVRFLWPSFR